MALLASGALPVSGADYEKDIKPMLHERCYACHGALKQKAGLRMDTVALMKQGGDEGNILLREDSLLLKRVTAHELSERMPPEGEGALLSQEQVSLLQTWIQAGAPGPADEQPEADPKEHWAYQRPLSKHLSIDALLEAKLKKRGLAAQPPAAPEVWLRRVYLDLTGLPPTPEQVQAFVQQSAAATDVGPLRGAVVDRLLASPQYGERWGRHFMDIWRYSDWYGLGAQLRYSQKHLWHWRDWIIESLNADKGYDQMILQMLAADELDPQDRDNLRATGFLARSYYLFNRTTWLDETVEHTNRAFLGLTMQCVKCHDHKYDPVSHAEYYQMRAIFEPLHVRLDPWPGVTDLEKDGLPRVYDLHQERPTYRHIRGDEKNEDKSRALAPGLPKILGGAAYQPVSVKLPAAVSRPVLLPFVLKDHLAAAEQDVARARANLARAQAAGSDQIPLAEKTLSAAEARPAMIKAVCLAEQSPQDQALARQAAQAAASYELGVAEQALLKAETDPALAGSDAKKKKAAQTRLDEARKKRELGVEKLAAPGTAYPRLKVTLKAQEGPDENDHAGIQVYPETSTGRRLALARWIANAEHPLTARVLVNHVWLRHFGTALVADVSDFGRRTPAPLHQDVLDTLAVRFMAGGWSLKKLHREMVLSDLYARSSSNAGADARTVAADPDNSAYWRMNARRMESQVVRDSLLHTAGRLDLTLGGPTLDPVKMETSQRRSLYFNQTANEEHRFLAMFDNASVLDCYRREESVMPQQALALANSRLSHDCAASLDQRLGGLDDASFVRSAFWAVLGRDVLPEEESVCLDSLKLLQRVSFLQALFNHNDFVTLR